MSDNIKHMAKEKFCKKLHIKPGTIKDVKKQLNIINDINRLRILYLFRKYQELCVNDIFNNLKLKQNLVSYHLRVLHQANLVERERRGGNVYYRERRDNIVKMCQRINKLLV